jgi:hypothetical protein
VEEYSFKLRIRIWGLTFCVEMVDAYILQFPGLSSLAEGLDKYTWCACYAAEVNVVAGLDSLHCLFG